MNYKTFMVEGYEILHSFRIGNDILVLGRNKNAPKGERYIASYIENTGGIYLFSAFTPYTSDSYLEAVNEYSIELRSMVVNMQISVDDADIIIEPIQPEECYKNDYTESILGKIIAIKRDHFRPEYETADFQICLVTGGVGAQAFAKGGKVECLNIYYGTLKEYRREDIQGVIKPECMPFWVENYLLLLQPDERVFEYRGYHFIPYRKFTPDEISNMPSSVIVKFPKGQDNNEDFYEASKHSDANLFLCLEDNTLYSRMKELLLVWMGERGEQEYLSKSTEV